MLSWGCKFQVQCEECRGPVWEGSGAREAWGGGRDVVMTSSVGAAAGAPHNHNTPPKVHRYRVVLLCVQTTRPLCVMPGWCILGCVAKRRFRGCRTVESDRKPHKRYGSARGFTAYSADPGHKIKAA